MAYKVVQWATGSVGLWSLKEILRHPDLELVGLRVYHPDKVGRDAGDIAGTGPVGVVATDNTEDILALDCDVVLHCPQAFGQMDQMTDDVVRLLESGKNVISVSDYISPDLWRPGLVDRLDAAGRRGGATIHGTGIDPGFLCDRLPATLTGLSTHVDHIHMAEIADLRNHPNPAMIMDLLGFGLAPSSFAIDPTNPGLIYCSLMFPQALHALFALLRVPFDRIEIAEPQLALATRDLAVAAGTVATGTVAGITWLFKGFRPSDPPDEPFATHQWSWYLQDGLPQMPDAEGHYRIHLDVLGTPDVRTVVDIDHPEDPFFLPTAGAAIRAIPDVVAAAPGHLIAPVFGAWSPRLR